MRKDSLPTEFSDIIFCFMRSIKKKPISHIPHNAGIEFGQHYDTQITPGQNFISDRSLYNNI